MVKKYKKKIQDVNKTTETQDAAINVLSGLGTLTSSFGTSEFKINPLLNQFELSGLYSSNGLARRIVDLIVDDSLRGFIDADIQFIEEFNRIHAKQKIMDAASWARLYGGSLLVAFVDDGRPITSDLNYKNIKKVFSLRVYDRYQVTWSNEDLSLDPYDEHYGEPLLYTITPSNATPFKVHRSRAWQFFGPKVPNDYLNSTFYWGQSALQNVIDPLKAYGIALSSAAEIISKFTQGRLAIKGLAAMLQTPGGWEALIQRTKALDVTIGNTKNLVFDSDRESYEKISTSISGFTEMWGKIDEAVSSYAGGAPITKLFGRSPAGLNSTGEHDANNWDGTVEAYRNDDLKPCINWLAKILEAQKLWLASERPDSYTWEFPPLKVQSEEQILKNRKLAAEVDCMYIDRGAVEAKTMLLLRYKNGFYDPNISIDEEDLKKYFGSFEDDVMLADDITDYNNTLQEIEERKNGGE
jgi:uncharacterized protein